MKEAIKEAGGQADAKQESIQSKGKRRDTGVSAEEYLGWRPASKPDLNNRSHKEEGPFLVIHFLWSQTHFLDALI